MKPTILESDGKPAFVVLTYDRYIELLNNDQSGQPRIPADDSVPHEVVKLKVKNNWSLIRSWREYLNITQTELASRLGITQPSYAAMEAPDANLKKYTRLRIAKALGVSTEQISV